MKPLPIILASLVGVLAACDPGEAGPPDLPDPFGTEPPGNGGLDQSPDLGLSLPEGCARACERLLSACQGGQIAPDCASSCLQQAQSLPPSCVDEFQVLVRCIQTAPISCINGVLEIPACDGLEQAVDSCQVTGGGGATGGGSGGTPPPPR